jgi:hypothetical protein
MPVRGFQRHRAARPMLTPEDRGMGGEADTVVAVLDELRRRGYGADFSVTAQGELRCGACGDSHRAESAVVEKTFRFEGDSNPDDEAVVFALRCIHCHARGALVAAYGPAATAEEAEVVTHLHSVLRRIP